MNLSRQYFDAELNKLKIAFEKKVLKAEKIDLLFERVSRWIQRDDEWRRVVEVLVEDPKFPSVGRICKLTREIKNAKNKILRHGTYTVECDCGSSFSIFATILETKTGIVSCECRKTYSVDHLFELAKQSISDSLKPW